MYEKEKMVLTKYEKRHEIFLQGQISLMMDVVMLFESKISRIY